jgi:hypothetical protein
MAAILSPSRRSYDPVSLQIPPDDDEKKDSFSLHSRTPLTTYPPMPAPSTSAYDPERASPGERKGHARTGDHPARPGMSSSPSWDLFAGARKAYGQFDTANATEPHLVFAEGDTPNTVVRAAYLPFKHDYNGL